MFFYPASAWAFCTPSPNRTHGLPPTLYRHQTMGSTYGVAVMARNGGKCFLLARHRDVELVPALGEVHCDMQASSLDLQYAVYSKETRNHLELLAWAVILVTPVHQCYRTELALVCYQLAACHRSQCTGLVLRGIWWDRSSINCRSCCITHFDRLHTSSWECVCLGINRDCRSIDFWVRSNINCLGTCNLVLHFSKGLFLGIRKICLILQI